MNDIRSKVAYLQGLAEGLEIDTASSEGRVLTSVIEVLGDLADQMNEVIEAQNELAEYVEDVDYDLGTLEESVLGEEDEETEEVRFIPEGMMTHVEDGVTLLSCPECGEAFAASVGEIETDLDVICPTCGCMIGHGEMEYADAAVADH